MADDKETSIADKTREFFKTKLDQGYPIPTDKPTSSIFVKEAMTTLGLKSGNRTKTKEILKEVLEKNNVDTSKMGFTQSVSDKFHFIKEEVPVIEQKITYVPSTEKTEAVSTEITLPKTSPIEKPKEPLPEFFKQRYHRDIGSITKWFHTLSVKHGIRQEEPTGQKPEIISLGEDWADYLYESGIRLPKALGFMFLMLRTVVAVVIPVFKFVFKPKKKQEQKPTEQKKN